MAGYNTYVGARYVPIFDGTWDKTKTYEPLVIVMYNGNSYTSKTYVPTNVDITNEDYWALTGNYNAQVEQYRKDVEILKFRGFAKPENYGAKGDGVTDDTEAIQECILKNPYKAIEFSGVYLISDTIKIPTSYGTVLYLGGSTIITNTDGITMIKFDRTLKPCADNVAEFYGIIGGCIDCNNKAHIGISNTNNRMVLNSVKVIDVKDYGIYDGDTTEFTALGQTFYSNVSIIQQRYSIPWSEGSSVGICLNGQDCRLENVSIMRCNKALEIKKTGHIISNLYMYAQGNLRLKPNLKYDDYTSYGMYINATFDKNSPLMVTNLYSDTLDYTLYNNATNSNWRIDVTNVMMYSNSENFEHRRELYLLGGYSAEINANKVRCYDNTLTRFYKGEYTNTDDINNGYTRITVSPNANAYADEDLCLNNLGVQNAYRRCEMVANNYYVLGKLVSSNAKGFGKWVVDVSLRGAEDLSFTCVNYSGALKIVKTNSDVGNTLYQLHVDTTLKTKQLDNGKVMYYYDVMILAKADKTLWVTCSINGNKPFADGYTKPYSNSLESIVPTTPIIVNYGTGIRFWNLENKEIAQTFQANNIVRKTYRLENESIPANFIKTIVINNPSTDVLTPFGIMNQFTSKDHVYIVDSAIDLTTNNVTIKVKNDTAEAITANIETVYTFMKFN